jgi:hypothetical protein
LNKVLPCIVCNKQLRPAFPEVVDETNHPQEGTVFIAWGNYGSSIHDPIEPAHLEITICDECLVERHEKVLLANFEFGQEPVYSDWSPPEAFFQVHVAPINKKRLS